MLRDFFSLELDKYIKTCDLKLCIIAISYKITPGKHGFISIEPMKKIKVLVVDTTLTKFCKSDRNTQYMSSEQNLL